jgi:PAS domain S-box-containing protein
MSTPPRILIVEDESIVGLDIQQRLTSLGYQVAGLTGSGEQALALTEQLRPDLILMDIRLGGEMDGIRAAELICRRWRLPVIFLTAYAEEDTLARAKRAEPYGYILKPFQDLELRSIIEMALYKHQAESALRESNTFNESLLRTMPLGMEIVDPDGRVLFMNQALETLAGGAALGQPCWLVHKDDRQQCAECPLKQPIALGSTRTLEITGVLGGRTFQISHTGMNYHNRPALLEVFQDITERKRGEEQIRDQASLLDQAHDAILARDLDGHILYWNKGAERLYGWTAAEAKDRKAAELHQPHSAGFTAARERLLAVGEWTEELSQATREGRKITVSSRCTLVRDAAGRPKSVLVINTDITDQKKLQAERLRAQRIESIGTLANGIAHDINNILMPIGLIVPMLREQVKDPIALGWLEMMETNVQRGAAIVKQVLTFSRGRQSEKVPTQTRQILKEVANVIRETFPKTIQLKTDWPKDLWPVLGDATQLEQVLMNLTINARDAMPEGGTLTVAAENMEVDELFACTVPDARAGPHLAWLVADTGQGISPEHLEHIFEPFFTTKDVGKGTGLGLSTVLGIVRDHGGFIRVESKVGEGARFRVYLPAQPGAEAAAKVSSQRLPQGKGELILVVDDEETIRNITRAVLERNGYQVLVAADGLEALTLITQNLDRIQAVLTDLIMPQMDGLTLIRAVRKLAPQIKTLVATGGESASRFGSLSLHELKTVLRKPFTPAALLQSLRALLDSEPPPTTGAAVKDSQLGGANRVPDIEKTCAS